MDKKDIRTKWIYYVALLFLVMLLETTFLPHIKLFGASPTHLLPYAVAAIAMLEGAFGGALAGLFAGVISDTMLAIPDGFYTLTFVICGVLVAFLCTLVFWRNYWTSLLYFIAVVLLTRLIYFTIFFLIYGETNILVFLAPLPAELLVSALFTPFLYAAIYKIAQITGINEEV